MSESGSITPAPRPEVRRFDAMGSSNIAWVAWYEADRTLVVSFRSKALYKYAGVDLHVYDLLRRAPSVGTAFDQHVKKGPYAFEQLLPITDRSAPTGEVPGTIDQR